MQCDPYKLFQISRKVTSEQRQIARTGDAANPMHMKVRNLPK